MSKKMKKLLKGANKTKAIILVAVLLVIVGASAYYLMPETDEAPPTLEPDTASELYQGFLKKEVRTTAGLKDFLVFEEKDKAEYEERKTEIVNAGTKPVNLDFNNKNLGVNYLYINKDTSLLDIVKNTNPRSGAIAIAHYSAEQGKWYITPNTYYKEESTIRTTLLPLANKSGSIAMADLVIKEGSGIAVVTLNASEILDAGDYSIESPVDYPICQQSAKGWYLYGINENWVKNIEPCFESRVKWVWAITPEWFEVSDEYPQGIEGVKGLPGVAEDDIEYKNFRKIYTTSDSTHSIMNLVNHEIEDRSLVWVYLEEKPAPAETEDDKEDETEDCDKIRAGERFLEIVRSFIENKNIIETDKKLMTEVIEEIRVQSNVGEKNSKAVYDEVVNYVRAGNYKIDTKESSEEKVVIEFTVPSAKTNDKRELEIAGTVTIHMVPYTPNGEDCPTWGLRYVEKTELEEEDECADLPRPTVALEEIMKDYADDEITSNPNNADKISEMIQDFYNSEILEITAAQYKEDFKIIIEEKMKVEFVKEDGVNNFIDLIFSQERQVRVNLIKVTNEKTGCEEWEIEGYKIAAPVGDGGDDLVEEMPPDACGNKNIDDGEECDSNPNCYMGTPEEIQDIASICDTGSTNRSRALYIEAGWCEDDISSLRCNCLPTHRPLGGRCILRQGTTTTTTTETSDPECQELGAGADYFTRVLNAYAQGSLAADSAELAFFDQITEELRVIQGSLESLSKYRTLFKADINAENYEIVVGQLQRTRVTLQLRTAENTTINVEILGKIDSNTGCEYWEVNDYDIDYIVDEPEPDDEVEEMLPDPCGNGVLDDGEQCDGLGIDDDGCFMGTDAERQKIDDICMNGPDRAKSLYTGAGWCEQTINEKKCNCLPTYDVVNGQCRPKQATTTTTTETSSDPICGNDIREGDEVCDGTEYCLDSQDDQDDLEHVADTCPSQTNLTNSDFAASAAYCDSAELCRCYYGYVPDPSNAGQCIPDKCGDGTIDPGEECDGGNYCYNNDGSDADTLIKIYVGGLICGATYDENDPDDLAKYNFQQSFLDKYPDWCDNDFIYTNVCKCYPGATVDSNGECEMPRQSCNNGKYDIFIRDTAVGQGEIKVEECDYSIEGLSSADNCCAQTDNRCKIPGPSVIYQPDCTCRPGYTSDGLGGCIEE